MALHLVYLRIIACYGLLCGGITTLLALSNYKFGQVLPYFNSYDARLLENFKEWHDKLHSSLATCEGTASCAVDAALHVVDLFFLFAYIPLCSMFAAFVLSNSTIKRVLFGEFVGSLLPIGSDVVAEMPALEHSNCQPVQNAVPTHNRRRASSSSRSSLRSSEHLVFDDTFGIIRKDIIESWNRPKNMNIDTTAPVKSTGPRDNLPPVRLVTPRGSVKNK